jgi:CHAD domain-containing protein
MKTVPDGIPGGAGLCWFGLQRLPPLLSAFEKEIHGVKAAEDIEYIHRMRVASRRLRAALPLFRNCFPKKQYSRWMREVSTITRALGEARDLDVQIAALTKYQKKSQSARNSRNNQPALNNDPLEPALNYLLDDLCIRRQDAQKQVIGALEQLEKSDVLSEMHIVFSSRLAQSRKTPPLSAAYGIPATAALRIMSRLAAMRAFEPWVEHEDAVAEHHAMRIAAKKLRYTMEVYAPAYKRGLRKHHARVKRLQEILGDLHDCDVWIDHVTRLLLRERGRLRTGSRRPDTITLAGLRLFLKDRERERSFLHQRFVRYWRALLNNKIWDEIPILLVNGRIKNYIPKVTDKQDLCAACTNAAAVWPEGLIHHKTVARLALILFDNLLPLHQLSSQDRCLLECAGILHDIGLMEGKRAHHVRSGKYIFSDESLPLDITDRMIAGLIATAHRGNIEIASHPLFTLLSAKQQTAVLQLTAIIIIANSLDYGKRGAVLDLHCIIQENTILCDIISPSDVLREKEQARSHANLFLRVFGRELTIR